MREAAAIWREDLDALSFALSSGLEDHGAACFVHRRAFRILIGCDPVGADCLAYYENNAEAFRAAAWAKIDRQSIPSGRSLNLNSRDIRRSLGGQILNGSKRQVKSCRVLSENE